MHLSKTPKINPPSNRQAITGLILAGGRGQRFAGQDKGLIPYKGKPLVEHTLERLGPQVNGILISANRNLDSYRVLGYPVITDPVIADHKQHYSGPLAGILAGLQYVQNNGQTDWLITAPCDTPCLPENIAEQLLSDLNNQPLAIVHDGQRLQSTFMLIHKTLADNLRTYLESGQRKAQEWINKTPHSIVRITTPTTSFININTPEDLNELEQHDCC